MIEIKVYEGLIRNHKELSVELGVSIDGLARREREERLVVAAYEKWGTDMGTHLNGQFAIALFDTEAHRLFCTRDILGAELFFYYETADGRVLYGATIRDLFDQPGFVRELNPDMIQFYMGFTYLPGEETLFRGVRKLEPGGYLVSDAAGTRLGRYWELTFEPDESKTLDEWADAISATMDASFESILDEGDVPDSFLSGGVDSSYILAKSNARCGYCASYENQQISEEEDARATAAHLGREFEGLTITPEQFLATVDEFLLAFELPTADVAALSLYCACKQMIGKSTLCFSGEGADEFFAGYSVYRHKPWYRKLLSPVYFGTTYIMSDAEQSRFLKNYNSGVSTRDFIVKRCAKASEYDELGGKLYTDMRTYFEGSILYNSTKISRGTGLDIRMPYVDLRMFDIARHMPSKYKVSEEGNKRALRAAASRVLPHEVAFRKKLGFPVPVREWLARPEFVAEISRAFKSETAGRFFQQDQIDALLDAFVGREPAVNKRWLKRRTALLWRYVWTTYTFIRWYELFFVEK